MDEYTLFQQKYRHKIVFAGDGSNPDKNKYLFLLECYSIAPQYYDINLWRQYKGIITWSDYWCHIASQNSIPVIRCNGVPLFNRKYSFLQHEVKPFHQKVHGITLLCRHRIESHEGNIAGKRLEIIQNINKSNLLTCHCYGRFPYGDNLYIGPAGTMGTDQTFPSSLEKLKVLNNYKFNLALENAYHPQYSIDYITEKIYDCLGVTVPIYYGCYNIEHLIPKECYIDYRQFKDDNELALYLNSLSEKKYNEILLAGYNFNQSSRYGNISDLGTLIDHL